MQRKASFESKVGNESPATSRIMDESLQINPFLSVIEGGEITSPIDHSKPAVSPSVTEIQTPTVLNQNDGNANEMIQKLEKDQNPTCCLEIMQRKTSFESKVGNGSPVTSRIMDESLQINPFLSVIEGGEMTSPIDHSKLAVSSSVTEIQTPTVLNQNDGNAIEMIQKLEKDQNPKKTPSKKTKSDGLIPLTPQSASELLQKRTPRLIKTPLSASRSLQKAREARIMQEQRTRLEIKALKEKRKQDKAAKLRLEEEKRKKRLMDLKSRNQRSAANRKMVIDKLERQKKLKKQQDARELAERNEEQREVSERLRQMERERRRRSMALRSNERQMHSKWRQQVQKLKKNTEDELLATRRLNRDDDLAFRMEQNRLRRESLVTRGQETLRLRELQEVEKLQSAELLKEEKELQDQAWQDVKAYEQQIQEHRRQSLILRGMKQQEERLIDEGLKVQERAQEMDIINKRKQDREDDAAYQAQLDRQRRQSLLIRGEKQKEERMLDEGFRQHASSQDIEEIFIRKMEMDDIAQYEKQLEHDRRESLAWHSDQLLRLKMLQEGDVQEAKEAQQRERNLEQQDRQALLEHLEEENEQNRQSLAFRRQQVERERLLREGLGEDPEKLEDMSLRYEDWQESQKAKLQEQLDRKQLLKNKAEEFHTQKLFEEGQKQLEKDRLDQEWKLRKQDHDDIADYVENEKKKRKESLMLRAEQLKEHKKVAEEMKKQEALEEGKNRQQKLEEHEDVLAFKGNLDMIKRMSLLLQADEMKKQKQKEQQAQELQRKVEEKDSRLKKEEYQDVQNYKKLEQKMRRESLLHRAQEFRRCKDLDKKIQGMMKTKDLEENLLRDQDRHDVLCAMAEENGKRRESLMMRREAFFSEKERKREEAKRLQAIAEEDRALKEEDRLAVEEYKEAQRSEEQLELELQAQSAIFNKIFDADEDAFRKELEEQEREFTEQERTDIEDYLEEKHWLARQSLLQRGELAKEQARLKREERSRQQKQDFESSHTLQEENSRFLEALEFWRMTETHSSGTSQREPENRDLQQSVNMALDQMFVQSQEGQIGKESPDGSMIQKHSPIDTKNVVACNIDDSNGKASPQNWKSPLPSSPIHTSSVETSPIKQVDPEITKGSPVSPETNNADILIQKKPQKLTTPVPDLSIKLNTRLSTSPISVNGSKKEGESAFFNGQGIPKTYLTPVDLISSIVCEVIADLPLPVK